MVGNEDPGTSTSGWLLLRGLGDEGPRALMTMRLTAWAHWRMVRPLSRNRHSSDLFACRVVTGPQLPRSERSTHLSPALIPTVPLCVVGRLPSANTATVSGESAGRVWAWGTKRPGSVKGRPLPRRHALAPAGRAERQRERWEQTPEQSWFSKWAPLPAGARRGPYVRPTRSVLLAVQAGLQRRLER